MPVIVIDGGGWEPAVGPFALNADSNDWSGYTLLVIFNSSIVTPGGSAVRVSFKASATEIGTILNAYIGHAAAAGDAYDFETTPVQLLFSGASSVAMGLSAEAVSDEAAFVIQPSKNVIVAYRMSTDATRDSHAKNVAATGCTTYYKNADDAATVNKTGYTGPEATTTRAVIGIETLS